MLTAFRVDWRRLETVVAALAARVVVVRERSKTAASIYVAAKRTPKALQASALHDASKPCSQSQKKLKVGYRDGICRQFYLTNTLSTHSKPLAAAKAPFISGHSSKPSLTESSRSPELSEPHKQRP